MLLSMTGHGEAHLQDSDVSVIVEVRTLNNRYFKLNVRTGDGYLSLEPRIEEVVRSKIRRGTVQVGVRVDRQPTADSFRLNVDVLAGYHRQLETLRDQLHLTEAIHLEALLALPGAVDERAAEQAHADEDWPLVKKSLIRALGSLEQMRSDEGRAMEADLNAHCDAIVQGLDAVTKLAPGVADAYRVRLTERLNRLLAEYQVQVEPSDVVREVGNFAERSDISEELVRLRSHVDQFHAIMRSGESSGRKLDFVTQEMFREANTIGSKANDAQIAQHVVNIKAAIERMREMIQNVE